MLLSLCIVKAQNSTIIQWTDHVAAPVFKEFIKAYNTNDLTQLQRFAKKYYAGKDTVEWASYWPGVFADFGIIEPYKIENEWTAENRLAIWFQGKDTKGWVVIILSMNRENTKIEGKSVARGLRPSGSIPPYKALSSQEIASNLESYLENLGNMNYFSGTVLVAKGDEVVFERAYGMRNKMRNEKNDLHTSFGIASTTKTFTAVAVLQLIEKGKIKLSDPLSKHIMEYPKDIADQVTVHHLLNHTSGIELDDHEPYNKAKRRAKNLENLLKIHLKYLDFMNEDRRPNFKVLGKHDYSNENFSLLGTIIERASGMTYAEYIGKNILKPIGMNRSFSDYGVLKEQSNVAIGYTNKDNNGLFLAGPRHDNTGQIWNFAIPSGGIYSNARDLYAFFKAINHARIINKTSKQWLYEKKEPVFDFSDYSKSYSYGFAIEAKGKAYTIGHGGSYIGIGSSFEYYPEQDYYVIVLSNYGSMPSQTISNYIKDLIEPND